MASNYLSERMIEKFNQLYPEKAETTEDLKKVLILSTQKDESGHFLKADIDYTKPEKPIDLGAIPMKRKSKKKYSQKTV